MQARLVLFATLGSWGNGLPANGLLDKTSATNAPAKLIFGCCFHFSTLNEMEKGNYCKKFKINVL